MRALILDSHLLLLLIVGLTSPSYIEKHRRLGAYTANDFQLLQGLVDRASAILVTPNTLTETSNLLAYAREPMKSELFVIFRKLIEEADERYLESARISDNPQFLRLGLTDSALLHVADPEIELLTADVELYLAALFEGQRVQNFNHLRESHGLV